MENKILQKEMSQKDWDLDCFYVYILNKYGVFLQRRTS